MAQIYGQLIRAQLQIAAADLDVGAAVTGLVYFNSSTGLKWHNGTDWKVAVDLDSTQILSGKTLNATCSINLSAIPSGISATKIADGSVDNTEFQKLGTAGSDALNEIVLTDSTQTISNKTFDSSCLIDESSLPVVLPSKGGTGITNSDLATLSMVGDHPITLTTNGFTSVILPTTGTLATLSGSEVLLNKTTVSSTNAATGALKIPVGNSTSQRPTGTAEELKGMIRYNDTDDSFEGYNELTGWSAIGGGGGGTTDRITQASHGFVVGDVLYLNGSTYAKAKADAANTAEVVGVVSKIIDASQFELTLSGEISGLTGLVAGEVYFLSAATAGALTVTEPTVVGQVSLPVGVASSTTSLYVAPKRGAVVGSSNARTQIALANNATTTVQNISAYDAGELTGWISITATTPLRFYVAAQFSKNGAANNYNVSYQVSGDTPPTGFSVTATAAGLLQVTLPSVTGFASASINYALNAPAVGTTFPLSVSARNVLGDTSGTAVPAGYVGEVRTVTGSGTLQVNPSTYGDIAGMSLQLGPGTWMLTLKAAAYIKHNAAGNQINTVNLILTDSSNAVITNSPVQAQVENQPQTSGTAMQFVWNLTSTTVWTNTTTQSIKMRGLRSNLTGGIELLNDGDARITAIIATRIA